ncbi:DNRLRE domain-containing protein [Knoellia koreensis]|uniref:DNRLRE domain-containing protein n=1 Tax=Knoellia koreensis TaxID=2730921 RepID=A0A849HIK4_9MICO|nr:DNRLRE domain-containing protein [Knoellia sp. DB2414S]
MSAEPLVAQDVRSAQLTARVRKQKVEVLSERTEDSTTFVNPDGSFTTESFGAPVRVRDKDGKDGWSDVDLELTKRTDGSVGPRVHPQNLVMAGETGETGGLLASIADGKGRQVQLDWKAALPEPTLSGTKATYAGIAPGVDLVQEATRTGVEQFLLLKDKAAVDAAVAAAKDGRYEVRIPITTKGLTAKTRTDGGLDFVDAKGTPVQTIAAPRMWDAATIPNADVPANEHPVGMRFEPTAGKGKGELVLSADAAWLADPARQLPITLDPTTTLAASHDTWVQEGYTTAQAGSTELRLGTFDGSTVARTFMKWNSSSFSKTDVTSATLSLWEFHSWSCTARQVDLRAAYISDTSTVWSNQPAATSLWYQPNFAKGFSSSCADGWVNIAITGLAQAWADNGATYQGIRLSATNEADVYGWKKFNSANASTNVPKLSVTYNRYPNTPGTPTHTPGTSSTTTTAGWSTSATPTLKSVVSDPDGGSVKGLFSVYLNGTGTPVIDKAAGSTVTSGGTSQYTVPAGKLVNGNRYVVRAYSNDGSLTSKAWSTNYDNFVVDTSAPATPTVASSTSPENGWSDALDSGGKLAFTATGTSADMNRVQYSLDAATYTTTINASPSTPAAISLAKPATGKHTLYVRSLDKAGNPSTGKAYVFYYGTGVALAQPVENHVTARRIPLQLQIDAAQVTALGTHKYQYRRGTADTWHDVPLADVTNTAGTTLTAWPATAASTDVSYWDAAKTLAGGGVIDVRAFFTGNSATTDPNTVTVDVNGGQGGDATTGPGSVNLLTGEYSLSDTDATLFGASVGRTYGSRSLTAGTDNGQSGAFGPQWAMSGVSEYTDANWKAVVKTSTLSVDVQDADDEVVSFTAKSSAAGNSAWTPEPGAEDLTLSGSLTSGSFTLKDTDGNLTTFTKPATTPAPPADTWPVASTTPTGAGATARYGYDTDPTGKLRLTRIAAPNAALSDTALQACADKGTDLTAAASRGCRTLELVWGVPAAGGFTGQRVTAIKAYTWDPAAASGAGAMTATTEATFGYDSAGRLVTATDPKPALTTGGQALTTTYTYDATTNLLTSLAPPGEQKWTFTYATGSTVAGPTWDRTLPTSTGRLVTVSRPTLTPGTTSTTNGTATTAVVYGVPVTTAARGPANLNQAATDTWNQGVAPVEGAAVFDADAPVQPAGDYWAGDDTTTRSWSKATVTYLDVNGREVNTLSRDGLIDATEYDRDGNPVFQIDGGNRALALGQGSDAAATLAELGLDGDSTDKRALELGTVTVYEKGASGVSRVKYSQGPVRTVVTAAGAQDQQRPTTRTSYDTGRPVDAATSDLATSTVTGGLARGADPATAALDNARTTTTTYDWALGLPLDVTTDPSAAAGDEITVRTRYDVKGRVIKQQQPSDAAGTGAGTRVTAYWDDNSGSCTGRPEWGDLVCRTSYAGVITGSTSNTALPVVTTSYNRVGAPAVVAESANGATRTTTTVFDAADRATSVTMTSTGLGSNPVAQTMAYDPATGALTSTSGSGKTMSTVTDTLGRTLTYTDASGLRATTSYDALGRATQVAESDTTGALSRVLKTTTAFDATTGRQTSQTDDQGGTITLGYDTAGNVTSQTWGAAAAGGLKATSRYDTSGAEIERVWTMTGQTDPVLSEQALENIHGQQVDHTLMPGGHRDYRYDGTGRLTSTVDLDAGQCTVRAYRFDANSNRTGYSSTAAAATADGAGDLTVCPSPVTPAATATFDTGDRITTAGHVYDAFGRTTRLPLASGQVARISYNANDLVASQTLYASAADADANSGAGQNPIQSSSYTLDLTGERVATRTAQDVDPDTGIVTPRTRTLRYASSGDSPDWTDEGDGTITRNITGANGDLVALATIDKTGAAADALAWQLSDIHGDVAATLPAADTAPLQISRPDEYGAGSDDAPRYGWLGAKQRAGDTPGGLILMGVRLYNPESGRFLSVDPVYGGNPNTYSYPADPVNSFDLDGRFGWGKWLDRAATGLAIAGMFGCAACAAVSAGISLGRGIYKVRHGDRSGWIDIAGAGAFGAAKGLRYAGRIWKARRIAQYPKGVRGGRASYNKRMRQRTARQHRRYERRYVHRADRIDFWYGAASTAYSIGSEYRSWRSRRNR